MVHDYAIDDLATPRPEKKSITSEHLPNSCLSNGRKREGGERVFLQVIYAPNIVLTSCGDGTGDRERRGEDGVRARKERRNLENPSPEKVFLRLSYGGERGH